jgi:transposase
LEEREFELLLVNARHVKILPGRKTDVADAAWLAELLEHGLLRGSFRPSARHPGAERPHPVPQEAHPGQAHTSEAQRVQKTLEDAGIKLDSVASDILGVSGRAMLKALVVGERDSKVLAEMARGRLRSKLPLLREALKGRFSEHHALLIPGCPWTTSSTSRAIAALDREVDRVMVPYLWGDPRSTGIRV